MLKIHLKCPCGSGYFIKYGGRRRQCVRCGRTKTIRPKKRGRKRLRASADLIERYFSKTISTIRILARKTHWGRDRAQNMMRRSLTRYVALHKERPIAFLPGQEPLIAIADAIWHKLNGQKLTIYLILLRPITDNKAIIMLPVFVRGHEDRRGWEHCLRMLPSWLKKRICALICDGQMALVAYGYRQGWAVQRCHFHLLANLEMYLGHRNHPRALALLNLVRELISSTNTKRINHLLCEIRKARVASRSKGIRRVLSGLQTNYRDFQTYLRYPKLHLPTTTNTAESCINGVRELMRRCRGFRNEKALRLWITGYILWKKTIRCNGKNQQK